MAELNVKHLIIGLIAFYVWIATISPALGDLAEKRATWRAGGYIDVHNHLQGWYREAGRFVTDYPSAAINALERMNQLQTALHLSFNRRHPFLQVQPDYFLFRRLADIAARHDIPIDLHMETVTGDTAPPPRFSSPPNPPTLKENISAFERLLSYNRRARIVWAHVGWDNTGHQTVALLQRLLASHPNLYLQIKTGLRPPPSAFRSPGARNRPVDENLKLRPEWLALFKKYPDRIVFGSDHFFGIPGRTRRIGQGGRENEIFAQLPIDLARKIGYDNPRRIYKLR